MDGAEFTRRLRSMPVGLTLPVVVVTAHDDRSFRVRALDAGATDFLQSPIDHFELVTRARNLLALGRSSGAGEGAPPPRAAAPADAAPWTAIPDLGAAAPEPPDGPAALARILDTVPAMISAADREGRCVFANAHLAAALGAAAPEDLIGAGAARLLGAERAARHRRDDLLVFETGKALPAYREELEGRGGDQPRHLLTIKTPLRDAAGAVSAVLTTSFDLRLCAAEASSRPPPGPDP